MNTVDIKVLRISLNMTQEQFAHSLGVTTFTVHRWETGKRKPSPMALKLIRGLKAKNNV